MLTAIIRLNIFRLIYILRCPRDTEVGEPHAILQSAHVKTVRSATSLEHHFVVKEVFVQIEDGFLIISEQAIAGYNFSKIDITCTAGQFVTGKISTGASL